MDGKRKPRSAARPIATSLRDIERRIAAAEGWAFRDWSRAMGGACGVHRLVLREPPLALADHVHLNGAGYAATADVLLFDLMNAYETWRHGARLTARGP